MIKASLEKLGRSATLRQLCQPEVCPLVDLFQPLLVFEIGHCRNHCLHADHQEERQDGRDTPQTLPKETPLGQRTLFQDLIEDGDEEEEEVGDANLAESKHLDFLDPALPVADLVASAPFFILLGITLVISSSVGWVADLSHQPSILHGLKLFLAYYISSGNSGEKSSYQVPAVHRLSTPTESAGKFPHICVLVIDEERTPSYHDNYWKSPMSNVSYPMPYLIKVTQDIPCLK